MMKHGFAALAVAGLLVPAAQAQDWEYLLPESELTLAIDQTDYRSGELAIFANGDLAFVDTNPSGDEDTIWYVDLSGATPDITPIAAADELLEAIDLANGAVAAPTEINVQAMGVNTNGVLIVATDGASPETAAVFAIDPANSNAISVLSCDTGSGSPVEGINGFAVVGDTACVLVESTFGAAEDAVLTLDTSTLVNTGAAPVTTLIGQADLLTATGETDANNMSLSTAAALDANTLLVVNSGSAASNDNIISVDLTTGAGSLYVAATDIEADLGATDVGFVAITTGDGKVFLSNGYGSGTSDDGIVVLSNVVPPNAEATVELESDIAEQVTGATGGSLYLASDALVYNPLTGYVITPSDSNGSVEGLIQKSFGGASSVGSWEQYK
ncbi:MAG: hypothetical protein PWP23_3334 [Candidatus Sumerlaeota bacterium]|nr:hypothetical protein [Candidatus Sumerlaeota bacterium]